MKSLRSQLMLRLLVGGALLLGCAGFFLQWQIRQGLTSEFDETLRATAQSLAAATEAKGDGLKMEFADEQMPEFERSGGSAVFVLRDAFGKEMARSRSLGANQIPIIATIAEHPATFDVRFSDGRMMRCLRLCFVPERDEEHEHEGREASGYRHESTSGRAATVIVGRDRAPLDHRLAAIRASLLAVGSASLVALALLVQWGVRGAVAPIVRFSEAVDGVNAQSLETRFSEEVLPLELRPIAVRLNELLVRLESAFARERRFTATAAHELRTPLAELRSVAEGNIVLPPSEAESAQSWRDVLSATLRMESLSIALLDLARAENAAATIRKEPVVLESAVAAAWRQWTALAHERNLAFSVSIPAQLAVNTDSAFLGVILDNLSGNAAEHSPAGSPVVVSAARGCGMTLLSFRNRAGDLTDADLPHLFERFWRKDKARSDGRHHGLGLALAAEFASLLGGRLIARLEAEDVEFILALPNADEAL